MCCRALAAVRDSIRRLRLDEAQALAQSSGYHLAVAATGKDAIHSTVLAIGRATTVSGCDTAGERRDGTARDDLKRCLLISSPPKYR